MYVGRIVAIARTTAGNLGALYRVSSRSFPNREAKVLDNAVAILPKAGYEDDIHKNPYIAYNCVRLVGDRAVVTNGTQTDHVANKLADGQTMRDALVSVMHSMDYERDQLDTPRIAAVVDRTADSGYLAIVRKDALHVQAFDLQPGQAFYVATYEHNVPGADYQDDSFDAADAAAACTYILGQGVFAELERPVTAACVLDRDGHWDVAVADAPQADEG
jgi:IMP cyclohydrolase